MRTRETTGGLATIDLRDGREARLEVAVQQLELCVGVERCAIAYPSHG